MRHPRELVQKQHGGWTMKPINAIAVKPSEIPEPSITRFLFGDARMAWVWLPFRLWLGWSWLTSGWGKFNNPNWADTGTALKSFWERALIVDPRPVVTYDWYRDFLQLMLNAEAYTWFAKVILFGEMAIGIALILGAFTGVAAFFGGFLNVNFLLAGTVSTSPLMFVIATWLVLAWKTAGYVGLDRYLLPLIGVPGKGGYLFRHGAEPTERVPREDLQRAA
jgi:thiosulfate dehydrogenase (quinone) large subunit